MRLTTNVARVGIGYLLAASFCISNSAWALTRQDVTYAINKAGILRPGATVSAAVDKDHVWISAYRDSADPKDIKIDAAMMAKTVSDVGGDEVNRITIRFFERSDMVSFYEVSLSKGDIKAFSSGQMGKEEFLSSMALNRGKLESNADKVARRLEGHMVARSQPRVSVNTADAVDISVDLEPWVSDEDAKLEALQIAMASINALPPEVSKVKVTFSNPAGGADVREVLFNRSDLPNIWKGVVSSLESASLAKKSAPMEVGSLTVALGPHREERERLLVQLKELDKLGVGIVPFVRAFQSIEANLNTLSDAALVDAINKLSTSLADQEKAFKAAKATKPTKTVSNPPVKGPAKTGGRWAASGVVPIIPGEVLANPDEALSRYEAAIGYRPGGDASRYVGVLEQMAGILRNANRASDAARFESKAASLRRR